MAYATLSFLGGLAWLPERETTRAVLTAVDIKIETRFLIGIWKPKFDTPRSKDAGIL
jgi:hypothetical protein